MKKQLLQTFSREKILLFFFCAIGFMRLSAQTNVSGNQSGTWTKALSPYIINGTVTVPTGQKLTIQPGVEVRSKKYDDELVVNGILSAVGTALDSIRFNGFANTAYNAASTHGGLIYLNSTNVTDSSVFAYVVIDRMGDKDYFSSDQAAVEIGKGKVTIRNSVIRNSELRGIYGANVLTVNPIISGVVFNNNPVPAFLYTNNVSGFTGNTNAAITLRGNTFANSAVTIPNAGAASYYILEAGSGHYFPDCKVTIQPGVEIRSTTYDNRFEVSGTGVLVARGTATDSIRFNGFANTAYNASSTHGGLVNINSTNASDSSVLAYTVFNRMGDQDYWTSDQAALEFDNGKITFRNSSIRNSELRGIFGYNDLAVNPIVAGNVFTNNPIPAILYTDNVGGFANNINAVVTLLGGTFSGHAVTIPKAGTASYYILEKGSGHYFPDSKVTIQPGVEIRSMTYDNRFDVSGTGVLSAKGTLTDSIRFTGFLDTAYAPGSTHGGYVNLNSSNTTDSSVLAYTVFDRMGDKDYWTSDQTALEFGSGKITVRNSSFRNSELRDIFGYNDLDTVPVVANNTFANTPVPVMLYTDNVGKFSGNVNAFITLRGGTFARPAVTISNAGTSSYYIMEAGSGHYFPDCKLTIQPGVEIKSTTYDNILQVSGTGVLSAKGTVTDSIKFTGLSNTAYAPTSTHGGIVYINSSNTSDSSVFAYTAFDRMGDKDYWTSDQAALEFGNGKITVRNSSIRNSELRGIFDYSDLDSVPVIANNVFANTPVPAMLYTDNVGKFSGNVNAIVTLRGGTFARPAVTISNPGTSSYYIMEAGSGHYFPDCKLTIQPGVEIKSTSYDNTLQVSGTGSLSAIGTVTDSIKFIGLPNTSYAVASTHGGLMYLNSTSTTDTSKLSYVVFDRMGDKDYWTSDQAALEIGGGKVQVTNSSIRNNENRGIYGYGDASGLKVSKSNIFNNKNGGEFTSGKPFFTKCNIYGNTTYGINNLSSTSTDIIDARTCWWGDSTGPKQTSTNPAGKGNPVSLKVTYKPFLTYPYQNNDIGIDSILTPVTSCNLSAGETVKVRIRNFGSATQTAFNVSYKINSGAVVTENVGTLSIASDSIAYYSFTAKADLSVGSGTVYAFKAFSALATDSIHFNDSAKLTIVNNKPYLGKDSATNICPGLTTSISHFYNTSGYSSVVWSAPKPDSVVAGTYSLIVTNSFGCKDTAIVTVNAYPATSSTFVKTNAVCFGSTGLVKINATGGTPPFKYKLDTAAVSKYQISSYLKGLKAGTYKVNIKDSLGCVATTSTIAITQPVAITSTFTKTDASCIGKADGALTINISGGTAPYACKLGLGGVYKDSTKFSGLKAGTYTVYIKDANGCTGTTAAITVGQANVSCFSNSNIVSANPKVAGQLSGSVSLMPNPSHGQFGLKVTTDSKQSVTVRLLDINGRVLYSAKGMPDQIFSFGGELAPGTYLVELRQGDHLQTLKAIKL